MSTNTTTAAAAITTAADAQSALEAATTDRDTKRAYAMRALAPLITSPDYCTKAGKLKPGTLANALKADGLDLHVNMVTHYVKAAVVYLERMGSDLDAIAALADTIPDERENRAAARYWDDLNRERRQAERDKREAARTGGNGGMGTEGKAGRADATEETSTGASAPMVVGPSWMDVVGLLGRLEGTVPGEGELDAVCAALQGALASLMGE